MSERFKLEVNPFEENPQYNIIDTEQEVLTIYNDLGCMFFTSAPALCELLNEQDDEIKKLKKENKELKRLNGLCEDQVTELRRLVHIANKYILDETSENIQEEWEKELMRE
ncbi:MAG: hypothetical protein IJF83_07270 [Methanobrevibacter sp.]|nr:hypothetical protein [Methanobrevibacter sp.]